MRLLRMTVTHDLCEALAGDITPYCDASLVASKHDKDGAASRFFFRFFVAPQYVQDRRIEAISFASTQNNSRNVFISSTHFLQLR